MLSTLSGIVEEMKTWILNSMSLPPVSSDSIGSSKGEEFWQKHLGEAETDCAAGSQR